MAPPHSTGISFIGHDTKSPFISPVDSAIGTGMTTENHSLVGDNDDLDQLPEDVPPNTTIGPVQGQPPVVPQTNHLGHNPSFAGMQSYGKLLHRAIKGAIFVFPLREVQL